MKLGLNLGYSGRKLSLPLTLVSEAEKLGFDSCWTSEAYGSDAISTSAWILARTEKIKVGTAILQLPARTPTMAAMTALSLDHLSNGRFIVGLGPSGPQVVEGWYGASYAKPLTRLREYIEIMRAVFAREAPVTYDGQVYQLPYRGADASGLAKPLKSILHAERPISIYTASLQPKAVAMSAELTDGFFPIWLNPERTELFDGPIA
ncbi:MAG TPA: LLM class flavin-dependent oxidoreductase, partial [Polyangiales bacterium]|nr:LLM class flavin-dependent oxidoreductase [Polyangiales bacterium]